MGALLLIGWEAGIRAGVSARHRSTTNDHICKKAAAATTVALFYVVYLHTSLAPSTKHSGQAVQQQTP